MKRLYIITLLLAMATAVMAQTPNIRYVTPTGAYANDGKSWSSAKKNIQDAINDLVDNGLTGEVWVKGATDGTARYTPTESTEQSGGSTLYMAFKIPAGITVRGGFAGTETFEGGETIEQVLAKRPFTTDSKTLGKVFTYKTILSGRLASTAETFDFDNDKQRFTPKFYGNTYHVVWFAMNGFDSDGRARALTGGQATLEGCIVEGGHANNNDLTGRKHNAYGGGIYMVDGAVVRDCEIRHCDASRDGGGVYMDGGGLLQHSYIHDCQALGVGVENGFGGGVCLEGVKQGGADNMTVIIQSVVSNNVGRMGGGLALKVNDTSKRTKLAANSVLVNNNTSTTAAGGVMLYKGGAVAGLTITRNRCNGSGIMVNGMQSGRAGGLFVLDKANIANCVIWGNKCDANNDIQYASHRTSNDNALKPDMKFCSLMRADLCDWSGTVKKSVRSLHDENRKTEGEPDPSMGYALFENPTKVAGYIANLGELNKGIDNPSAEVAEKTTMPIDWQVFSESALHHAGIQTVDIDNIGETDSPAETYDVCGSAFNPRVTLGAYVASMPNIVPEVNGSTLNFYVDPNHVFAHHNNTANSGNGHSWTEPTRYLANVLYLIKNNKVKDGTGAAIDLAGKTINIYVKEGTINNTNSYVSHQRVRNVAIEVPSNVNIYGGYPSQLTGTNLQETIGGVEYVRNPRLHQTVITGDIMGDFNTNVAHLVVMDGASNVLIDGVQIRDANATSTALASHGTDGAALSIKNSTSNISIKNVLIANNQAAQGAAVLAENSTVSFENCIFHNNTSSDIKGIIASTGTSVLSFNHCDVLRNVGYASWLEGSATNDWQNSIIYGNLDSPVENTNISTGDLHTNALPAFGGSNTAGVTGSNSMFDAASASFSGKFTDAHSKFNLSYRIANENDYPRFINPTRNSGHSIGGDVTFYGRSTSFEPHNLNPIVNAASHTSTHDTWGKDMSTVTPRDFGGLPDIGAIENHQDTENAWENAYTEGQAAYGSIYYVRDYATTDGTENVVTKDYIDGNYVVNANGTGKYNANNELFDGSSWEYAINGNADYEARTVQLPTFTLSFVDANDDNKVKYLGYRVTTETVAIPGTDPVEYDNVTTVHMSSHLNWGGQPSYAGWYSMEITENPNEAIHFEVNANNRLTFSVQGRTYGLGYGTSNPWRNLVFIQNYNGGDGFVYDPITGYCKSGGYYYTFRDYTYSGETKTLLAAKNTTDGAISFTRTYDQQSIPAKGLQWAVDNAKEHGVKNIRVAAGKYTNHNERNSISNDQAYAFMMEEGVDVLGGYPKYGNPGEEERQPKENITILQIQDEKPTWRSATDKSSLLGEDAAFGSASVGRVLVQPTNFVEETKWDGFTIRHGFLHSWYRHNIAGDISRIQTERIGTSGGAGVYLMGNGVLENCEIMDNVVLVVATDAGERTGYQAANSVTSNGGFHQAGAGVYMTGSDVIRGTIKNCDIHGNQLLHKYWKQGSNNEESSWMYGAGLYMDNGTVYNTVIHNNMMRVIKGNREAQYGNQFLNEVLVGAGAFLVKGEFYNNTVVNNEAHSFCTGSHMRHVVIPGVYIYNSMTMYNSIVAGNTSTHANIGQTQRFDYPVCSFTGGGNFTATDANVKVKYSYIDIADNDEKNLCKLKDEQDAEGNPTSRTNIYLNSKAEGNYSLSDILNVDGVDKYRLTATSPCFNAGTESIPNDYANPGDDPDGDHSAYSAYITIPDEDADYTFRVKDCRIDIGAYELNGAVGIHPEMFDAGGLVTANVAEAKTAVYYVTPEGYGSTNASDPANAACAQKLQRVIDTAARFKFLNPTKQVIVKVANSYSLANDGNDATNFKYYATRTTNQADENVRVWSIIIPRGVEVWGGYTDVARTNQTTASWTNADNGFKNEDGTDARNITGNPTYFDSYYENKLDHSNANCYHVVTFSDRVFDAEGNPYMQRDLTAAGNASALFNTLSTYDPLLDETEDLFLHMSDVITPAAVGNTNLHRAVLDGIYVTGGKADAQGAGGSSTLNINQYGGAAIVTPYAHVRNCILKNNNANNGGALALTHQAIVSGTLMVENSANQNGGALYVFEEGDQLSDGTIITSLNEHPSGESYSALMDYNMAHVFTSTIVRNQAPNGAGGGIWFTENNQPNVRINSSVFWQNTALDQANVAGMLSPEKPVDDQHSAEEFYPFAYSAIQDIRASGTNNFAVNSINSKGTRFANTATDGITVPVIDDNLNANDNISSKYGLIGYSTLTHTGMPVNNYTQLMAYMGVAEADYMGVSRTVNTSAVPRTYVEVGARAIDKQFSRTQPMYRLFVAKPDDVDMAAAKAMMTSDNEYYKQEGSSFAYPFLSLQDALDYIHLMRYSGTNGLLATHGANNIPFEICVAKGTYHPKRDLVGNTDHALSATFSIPEGVSIYGGFNCQIARDVDGSAIERGFYGKGFETVNEAAALAMATPAIDGASIDIYSNVTKVAADKANVVIGGYKIVERPDEYILSKRHNADLNANSIIEPWEFEHQTIFAGDASAADNNGVYHVMTVVPDENIVGTLPVANKTYKDLGVEEDDAKFGMEAHMQGQQINIDGVQVQGGYAYHYVTSAFTDDPTSDYNYYHGGGLLIDGNRYCDVRYGGSTAAAANPEGKTGVVTYKHTGRTNAVGYRDIPVNIRNCKFMNNRGGFGGAISSNTTLNIFQSSFEQNMAVRMQETFKHHSVPADEGSSVTVEYPGNGGAIHSTYRLHAFNTLFANNEAMNSEYSIVPKYYHTLRNESNSHTGLAIQGGAGGAISVGKVGIFHVINCNFVKNKANMYPAVFTMNPNYSMADATDYTQYSKFANTVFWGNAVNENMTGKGDIFNFASKLICNFGPTGRAGAAYDPSFTAGNAPADQAALDANYQETAWFCAYEEGTGKTANHNEDMRDKEYSPLTHVENIFKTAGDVKQNCNIIISKENNVLEGPNFVNPSHDAGVAGYLESADWSPARINNLTDNGSGKIQQTISLVEATQKYGNTYDTYTSKSQSVPAERTSYSNETAADYVTSGIYTTNHYLSASPQFRQNISLGDAKPYMQYVNGNENIYRISFDPNPTHDHTYVDIGVYEYVHVQLNPTGDEVDVLWVSTEEKPENGAADGSAWTNPTSDLQRAIETLLASRNGHRKEVRLMDGTFTPTYTIDGNLSFYIDTHKLNQNVILPLTEGHPVEGLGVTSLTIKGGYSKDLEGEYDVERYPSIIKGQQRTEYGSDRWNHAFYIYDATQRYGRTGGSSAYNSDNNYGATKSGQTSIQTIPIEVDGITFINDQALAGTKGTGLYYEAQEAKTSGDHNLGATTGTSNGKGQKLPEETTVDIQTPAALIISKCKFYGNGTIGTDDKTTSAVYVGTKGAIKSLIYNNVFHTNEGKPLEAYNAMTINNTYGLNGSYIDLMNDGGTSSILNSAMWRNNKATEGYGVQAMIAGAAPTAGITFNYNAYTIAGASESAPVEPTDANQHNASLANDNSDLFNGPNFIDPENADLAKRNFNLMPSFRLLNTGLNTNYDENLVVAVPAAAPNPALYSAGIYDLAQYSTVDKDAALNTRKIGTAIDLGAYEYQNVFQRVFYVDPNSTKVGNDGKTWEDAMCYGSIQDAINMGALYSKANSKEAYVFVKGASATNKGLHTGETITPRNGVKVFGSIAASYNKLHNANPKTQEATDGEVTAFEALVINDRMGLAEPISNKTTIAGIKTSAATNFSGVTVIDGFDVTATSTENATGAITEPIINIAPNPKEASPTVKQFALRNLIVRDNDASAKENVNIVEVDKALIYEVLMRDNKVNSTNDAVLKLGTNGYAVNVTVEGKSVGADGTSVLNGGTNATAEAASHIFSSLVNYADDAATKNTLSGYNYELEDKNLNYQLAEMSKHIDACATTNPVAGITEIEGFIDYAHDRDLLGNPRMMKLGSEATNLIDRGAFETWKVDVSEVITDAGVAGDASKDHNGWSGIHYYPHDGSVVYIMEGNNLVSNHDLTPGFLLVQKGASLYGQGNAVNAAYVAVERNIRNGGSIVALPYVMKYNSDDAAAPAYDANGVLSLTGTTAHAYNYSGSERSAWDYIFAKTPETSNCWKEIADPSTTVVANNGVLYEANGYEDAQTEKLVRFTGKGTGMDDYIYTESGVSKTVLLHKYDDAQTDNKGADFTNPLDMGWNCFGLPYLVSEYKPYEKVTADAGANTVVTDSYGKYTMNPHTLWLYYDGVHTPDYNPEVDEANQKKVDGDGGYYSVQSWESSNNLTANNPWHVTDASQQAIWVGEGIFTQTATLKDAESLVFYRPIYTALGGGSSARTVRYYGSPTSIEENREDMKPNDAELIATEYYTIDGTQILHPQKGSIVIVRRKYSNGAVKATKQVVR